MPTELTKGSIVAGRYRLERALGEGGMGSVWLAVHTVTHRQVALKFLKAAADAPALRERFLREARAASAVRHPNVVEVLDILDLEDGAPLMVMEYLEGESLGDHLHREGKLDVSLVARILLQVVSGVGAAHAAGVIHRDLKPHNIFLVRGDGPVRVLDFGIAKLMGQAGESAPTELTATGTILGTPSYMAPEQVFGEKDIDHRTDIWALGIILYQSLSGTLPTEAENVGQVIKLILAKPIKPLSDVAPDVPGDIVELCVRMLSRSRKSRPLDLREVAAVLRRHTDIDAPDFGPPSATVATSSEPLSDAPAPLDGEPTEMMPLETTVAASSPANTTPTLPRSVVGALLAAVGIAAVVGGGFLLSQDDSRATPPTPDEPSATLEQPSHPPNPLPSSIAETVPPSTPSAATTETDHAEPARSTAKTMPPVPVRAKPAQTAIATVTAAATPDPPPVPPPAKTSKGQVIETPPF